MARSSSGEPFARETGEPTASGSAGDRERLTVVGIYAWSVFWAIGEDQGSPSFYLSPKGFVNAGHRMVIVMPRGAEPPGTGEYRGIETVRYAGGPETVRENPNEPFLVRTLRRQFVYWKYVFASYRAGRRVCREVKPDAIIAYGDYSVLSAHVLARRLRIPLVTRLFGTNLGEYLGRPFWLLYHYIHVLPYKIPAHYMIMCNDGSRGDRVARALGVAPERLLFWRNGGSHDGYRTGDDRKVLRAELGLPTEGPLAFTISRLHPEKRIERILRALPEALERHPLLRLVVIGQGPDEARLRAEADTLGVSQAVVWPGALPREALMTAIAACDVFVAMSDRTNAANPLFEAMLGSRPGIVLDTGDTSVVIDDGVNGWLVPDGEADTLGRVLSGVLDDPERIETVGAAARAWAIEHIPTYERRQHMEVGLVETAVHEHRNGLPPGAAKDRRAADGSRP